VRPGADDFTLTIAGYGFQQGAQVLMSGVPLVVLRVDSAAIAVRVPAVLVALVGLPVVMVRNPDGQQVGARFAVSPPPTPTITRIAPNPIPSGLGDVTVEIQGVNFGEQDVRVTADNFIITMPCGIISTSPTKIVVRVPKQITCEVQAGLLKLIVQSNDRSSVSGTVNIAASLYAGSPPFPSGTTASMQAFTLRVFGIFKCSALKDLRASFNDTPLPDLDIRLSSVYTSDTLLIQIPASLNIKATSATIYLGTFSRPLSSSFPFTINAAPPPSIFQMSPVPRSGGGAFTLGIDGISFSPNANVRFNGQPVRSVIRSGLLIEAQIPAEYIASAQPFFVTVTNPDDQETTARFPTPQPQPSVSAVVPSSTNATAQAFSMRFIGYDLSSSVTVTYLSTPLSILDVKKARSVLYPDTLLVRFPANMNMKASTDSVQIRFPNGVILKQAFIVLNPLPVLNSPNSVFVLSQGACETTVTIQGRNFGMDNLSVVAENGETVACVMSKASSTEITVRIPQAALCNVGEGKLTVRSDDRSPVSSRILIVPNGRPVSVINPIFPSTTTASLQAFTLSFLVRPGCLRPEGISVSFKNTPLRLLSVQKGTSNNPDTLRYWFPDSLNILRSSEPIRFAYTYTACANSETISLPFTIYPAPPPILRSLSPEPVFGGAAFTLSITGSNFQKGAAVYCNGQPVQILTNSPTLMTVAIPASLIASSQRYSISVVNRDGQEAFVRLAGGVPVLSLYELIPSSTTASLQAFTLRIVGYDLPEASTVTYGSATVPLTVLGLRKGLGIERDTLFVRFPASANVTASTGYVTMVTPEGRSLSQPFTVQRSSAPVILSLSPSQIVIGGPALTLSIEGTGFQEGVKVRFSDQPVELLSFSPTLLKVFIPASLIASSGLLAVKITNPDGQEVGARFPSAGLDAFEITSVNPSSITSTTNSVRLIVTGRGLNEVGSAVLGTMPLQIIDVTPTSTTLSIPAGSVPQVSTATVYLLTLVRKGGQSFSVRYTIYPPSTLAFAAPTLTLNPNPVTDVLTITADFGFPLLLTLRLLDVLQREALPPRIVPADAEFNTQLDMSALPRGVYMLELTSADGRFPPQVRQVVKQ
jgi:hypothetical protein